MIKFELWSKRGGGSSTPTKLGTYDTLTEARNDLDRLAESKSGFKWQGLHITTKG